MTAPVALYDFLGQPITADDCWLATGGRGNVKAEYGMILHKVLAVVGKKLKVRRLTVAYTHQTQVPTVTVGYSDVTVSSPTKFVRVNPSAEIRSLFSKVEDGKATLKDANVVGKWLHGKTEGLFHA